MYHVELFLSIQQQFIKNNNKENRPKERFLIRNNENRMFPFPIFDSFFKTLYRSIYLTYLLYLVFLPLNSKYFDLVYSFKVFTSSKEKRQIEVETDEITSLKYYYDLLIDVFFTRK